MKLSIFQKSLNLRTLLFVLPFAFLLFLSLNSCNRKIETAKLPGNQIVFGGGGGFTGQAYEYALLEDGRLVEIHRDSAKQRIVKKIGKKEATDFYTAMNAVPTNTWLHNAPGNIYHFVIVKKEGQRETKAVWDGGGNNKNIPEGIETLYKKLMAEVPQKK